MVSREVFSSIVGSGIALKMDYDMKTGVREDMEARNGAFGFVIGLVQWVEGDPFLHPYATPVSN